MTTATANTMSQQSAQQSATMNTAPAKAEKFRKDRRINWWLTAVVAVFSLTILVPLYFTVVTALKTPAEAGTFSLPTSWQWGNFAAASAKVDYPAGLIVLYVILGLGTNLFIATGFIRSIPVSLEEAARIDGAGTWRIFWKIIFPLMGPINATIAIMTALWAWNDFLLPLIILTDQSNQTIPLAQYVFSSQFATNYPQAFASYLMAMAPVLVVYIFAQKWVVGGVMRGAVK